MVQQQIVEAGSLCPAAVRGSTRPGRQLSMSARKGTPAPVIMVVGVPPDGRSAHVLERALGEAGLDPGMLQLSHGVPTDVSRVRLIVAMGTEIASALLRRPINLAIERGRVLTTPQGTRVLATEHPATILGLVDGVAKGREYRRLVNDLQHAVPVQRRAA